MKTKFTITHAYTGEIVTQEFEVDDTELKEIEKLIYSITEPQLQFITKNGIVDRSELLKNKIE